MKAASSKDLKAIERYRDLCQQIAEDTQINPFETAQEKKTRIDRAKKDYAYFVKTYFPKYATSECADFHVRGANMIIKNRFGKHLWAWGRGLAKSTHADIMIPLWLWINNELKVMLLVGVNEDAADVLLSDLQAHFEHNQLLIHDYGAQKTIGSWTDGEFVTKNDCAFFARGIGQPVRGTRHRQHRPDYIVVDDVDTKEVCRNPKRLRQYESWICEDLIPASDITGCRYVQVNNIIAEETILTRIRDNRKGFRFTQVDCVDANGNPNWPQKYTKEYYDNLRDELGTISFNQEFMNAPTSEGSIFTQDMIQWERIPQMRQFHRIIGYWDIAYSDKKTADFNAVRVWGEYEGKFYLIDSLVMQCKMNIPIRWIHEFRSNHPNLFIPFYYESQFWNEALQMVHDQVQEELQCSIPLIRDERPKGNKYDRIMRLHPFYQQRRIIYNINKKTDSSFQQGISQLMGIEPGYKGHDDAPDSDSEAVSKLAKTSRKNKGKTIVKTREKRQY